jgi:coenzyme PQQ precursor peptide PqqA
MPRSILPIEERGNTGGVPQSKEICMKWETPAAIEMRFGMEITMYVANR